MHDNLLKGIAFDGRCTHQWGSTKKIKVKHDLRSRLYGGWHGQNKIGAGVALTICHIANGETVMLVAKDIRGHCATVAKRFSEWTYRTHPPCSTHVFSFWPLLSCGVSESLPNSLYGESALCLKKNEVLTKLNQNYFPVKWIIYIYRRKC